MARRVLPGLLVVLACGGAAAQRGSEGAPRVFIAVYEIGPGYDRASPIREQAGIREHVAHHEALGGRLIAAGPFRLDEHEVLAGAVVFTAPDLAAARAWLAADPAVLSGALTGKVMQWGVSRIVAYEASSR